MNKSVYVIRNDETKRIKIGVSENVRNRLLLLVGSSGCNMTLLYNTPIIENAEIFERELHAHFKKYRYIGEWFDVDSTKVIKYVKDRERNYELHEKESCIVFGFDSFGDDNPQIITQDELLKIKTSIEKKDEKEYKTKILKESLSRYKRIRKNIYMKKATKEVFFILYKKGQWLSRKLRKSEYLEIED